MNLQDVLEGPIIRSKEDIRILLRKGIELGYADSLSVRLFGEEVISAQDMVEELLPDAIWEIGEVYTGNEFRLSPFTLGEIVRSIYKITVNSFLTMQEEL